VTANIDTPRAVRKKNETTGRCRKFEWAMPRWIGWFGGDFNHLLHPPGAIVALPKPDRGRQILQRNDYPNESVRLGRVMSRAQFQDHLLLLAEVQRLDMTPPA